MDRHWQLKVNKRENSRMEKKLACCRPSYRLPPLRWADVRRCHLSGQQDSAVEITIYSTRTVLVTG